jgi:circadian clock protein KaiB
MPAAPIEPDNDYEVFEQLLEDQQTMRYVLRLYVAGLTANSLRAIDNLKNICDDQLQGRYDLEVVDVSQQPSVAKAQQLIAAPTLIKALPLPLRRLIGDLSDKERVLVALDLKPRAGNEV